MFTGLQVQARAIHADSIHSVYSYTRHASETGTLNLSLLTCRYKPEQYMQTVFAVSAVTLVVPVAYHLQRSSETSSLDPNAPGRHRAHSLTTQHTTFQCHDVVLIMWLSNRWSPPLRCYWLWESSWCVLLVLLGEQSCERVSMSKLPEMSMVSVSVLLWLVHVFGVYAACWLYMSGGCCTTNASVTSGLFSALQTLCSWGKVLCWSSCAQRVCRCVHYELTENDKS